MTVGTTSADTRLIHDSVTGAAAVCALDQAPRLLAYGVFRAARDQVSEVRGLTHDATAGHAARELAVLLVSELMTNAVVHSGSRSVTVLVLATIDGGLRVCVIDEGRGGLPRLVGGGPHDEHGRGLRMVDHLSKSWGIHRRRMAGMTVWFELDEKPPEAWLDFLVPDDL